MKFSRVGRRGDVPVAPTLAPIEASVIVAARNAADHIEQQLNALARQRTDVIWELIVADNGSTDGTPEIVRRALSVYRVPATLIDASDCAGQWGARGKAVAAASGEFLLFADGDDVVDDHWVQEMVSALRQHPYVGGRLEVLELNGEEVAGWRRTLADDGLPVVNDVPWAVGCNVGATAAALAAIGGFAEHVVGWDDVDLGFTMHAHGMPAVFAQRAIVHYRYRRSPRYAIGQQWRYGTRYAPRYSRYGIAPPTFLDVLLGCSRNFKVAIRRRLRGVKPVREAAIIAYALGEASVLWRNPRFWQPVYRREAPPVNPGPVQLDRIRRLARLLWRVATVSDRGA